MTRPSRIQLSAWFSMMALGLAMGAAGAQAVTDAPKKVASVEGITEYRLDNGLRVLLFPDQSRPKVAVNLTVLVGSRHEGYGETGMAHLLEHMIKELTPEAVNAAVRKYIDPRRISVVTAGDFKK